MATPTPTRVIPFSNDAIAEAARLILAGEPVAVPTETVYGLAADATNAEAVARILRGQGAAKLQSADRACARPCRGRSHGRFR
jgi:L-threonylcarbamoyladenylate synthase